MIYYKYILVSNLIFYGMIIFRELEVTSNEKQLLFEQLRQCRLNLHVANFEKKMLNEEVNLKSKLNKQLEDNLKCLEDEKRSLQEKVSNRENTIFSLIGRNPRSIAHQRLLLERPIPEEVRRPKLTDPAEGDSCTSTMVRDWNINLVQLSFQCCRYFVFLSLCKLRRTERFSSRAVYAWHQIGKPEFLCPRLTALNVNTAFVLVKIWLGLGRRVGQYGIVTKSTKLKKGRTKIKYFTKIY
jgi:hypothetical protein